METWMPCVDYPELFEVSNLGRIRSLRNPNNLRILKPTISKKGYFTIVTKVGGRSGKNVVLKIHREVAKAFIPNPFNLPEVDHIDFVKTNNNVENLEWVTSKRNVARAIKHGRHYIINAESLRKLTDEEVKFCLNNYIPRHKHFGVRALARKFKVDHTTVLKYLKKSQKEDKEK